MPHPSIRYYLLVLAVICFYATYRTYKKGHPFSILALVIFNCGLLCFHYSRIIYIELGIYSGSLFSNLMFPLGLLVFYRNIQTKSINRLDKILLGIACFEYIFTISLNFIRLIFSTEFFTTSFGKEGVAFLVGEDMDCYNSYFCLLRFGDILFFYLQIIVFPLVIYQIYKGLVKAKENHLNFFVSDSFHFYRWNFNFLLLIAFCYIIVAGFVLLVLFDMIDGSFARISFVLVGLGGIGFGLLSYYAPKLLSKEKDFPKLLHHLDPKTKAEPFFNVEDDKFLKYKTQLLELLEKEKCYRNPKLSLATLAQKMDISTRHLSRIINDGFGKSFSELINQYRIEEVKNNLTNSDYEHYAILSIGLEAGFNSKTSFYSTFKKYTSMTPVQFKNNHFPK